MIETFLAAWGVVSLLGLAYFVISGRWALVRVYTQTVQVTPEEFERVKRAIERKE